MAAPIIKPIRPQAPTPTEEAQWQIMGRNARSQYMASLGSAQYNQRQAKANYGLGTQQAASNFGQTRGSFDDPYINRGIFNSGIRNTGLSNLYGGYNQQLANLQRTYEQQYGQGTLDIGNAAATRNNALQNADMLRRARTKDLASQIAKVG